MADSVSKVLSTRSAEGPITAILRRIRWLSFPDSPFPLLTCGSGSTRFVPRGDPQLFFHPEGERGPARHKRDAAAVEVCAGCPVIQQCREHGLSVREPYGVWGGLTEEDREGIYLAERKERREARKSVELREAS